VNIDKISLIELEDLDKLPGEDGNSNHANDGARKDKWIFNFTAVTETPSQYEGGKPVRAKQIFQEQAIKRRIGDAKFLTLLSAFARDVQQLKSNPAFPHYYSIFWLIIQITAWIV